jgi:hypothetical protein
MYLDAAGLAEIKRISLSNNKFKCTLSILQPIPSEGSSNHTGQHKPDELIIAIVDGKKTTIAQTLTFLHKKDKVMPLKSVGLVSEDISVQPGLYAMAKQALKELKDFIEPINNNNVTYTDGGLNITVVNIPEKEFPKSLRFIGYSVGGGVAALTTYILDGTLVSKDVDLQSFSGLYKDKVKCVCIGPPPSISRSILSRNVISIVCGDDCVSRATFDTIEHVIERVTHGLQQGAGKSGWTGLGYALGPGLFKDLSAVAGNYNPRRNIS